MAITWTTLSLVGIGSLSRNGIEKESEENDEEKENKKWGKIKIARKRETVTKNKQTKKSMARKYTMCSLLPVVGGAAKWSLPSCSCKIEALALPVTNSLS